MAFRIRPDRPFTEEFRSVARRQLEQAIHFLEDQPNGPHEAIHDARKKFKRVRALYRLVQADAREFRHRENARIRDMAKTLSVVRDATALVETVDYLASEATSPDEISALSFASRALIERRDRIAEEEADLPEKIAAAIGTCRDAIAALDDLKLEDGRGKTARRLAKAWRRQMSRAAADLLACEEGGDTEAFHDLRKVGQIYWMHLSLLSDLWPSAMRAKRAEAKALVDILGHEHDLSVLTQVVNENPDLFGDSDTLARLIGAIIARQQELRQRAIDQARRVFADDADAEASRIALLWQEAASRR